MRLLVVTLAVSAACTARVGFDGRSEPEPPPPGGDTSSGDTDTCPNDALQIDFPLEGHPIGWAVPVRGSCTGSAAVTVTIGGDEAARLDCNQGRVGGFVDVASRAPGLGHTTLTFAQGACAVNRNVTRTTDLCDTASVRALTLAGGFAGGDGSLDAPFVLCTPAQLLAIDEDPTLHYELRNDLDLSHADSNGDGTINGSDVVIDPWPVVAPDTDDDASNGYTGTPFTGVLVGHGHAVLDLHIDTTAGYQGLFGSISGGVRHLSLGDVDIRAGPQTGALAGVSSGDQRGLSVNGTIRGGDQTGGVVGQLQGGVLLDVFTDAVVEGGTDVGGLAGGSGAGEIRYASVRGTVSGDVHVGGIAGVADATISDVEVDVVVAATTADAGGVVGDLGGGSVRAVIVRGSVTAPVEADPITNDAGGLPVNEAFFSDNLTPGTHGTPLSDAELIAAATYAGFDHGIWSITDGSMPALRIQPCVATPAFDSGAGTNTDPYRLSTALQLYCVRLQMNGHFRLTADIDLASIVPWVPIGHDRDWDRTVGNAADNFTGEFDGGGHAITGLEALRPGADHLGLFARSQRGGWIHDFSLEGDVQGRALIGLLIGGDHYTGGAPAYENLIVAGTVTGAYLTGGLVGGSTARVANVQLTVDVAGANDTGGVAGSMGNARGIFDVTFDGTVTGGGSVGGAVGRCFTTEGPLDDFTFVGTVTGTGSRVGGVTGRNTCRIRRAIVSADVTGTTYVGGIVGWDYFDSDDPSEITDSAVLSGTITGDSYVGGLAGYNESAPIRRSRVEAAVAVISAGPHAGGLVGDNYTVIRDSYALCSVSGAAPTGGLAGDNGGDNGDGTVERCFAAGSVNGGAFITNVGGLIGNNDGATAGLGAVTDSFWDVDVSGLGSGDSTSESEGGLGKTTAALYESTTFINWDFATIWLIDEGNDYPRLRQP